MKGIRVVRALESFQLEVGIAPAFCRLPNTVCFSLHLAWQLAASRAGTVCRKGRTYRQPSCHGRRCFGATCRIAQAAGQNSRSLCSLRRIVTRRSIAFRTSCDCTRNGDPKAAVEFAQRYLRQIPAHSRLVRTPGLELLIRGLVELLEFGPAHDAIQELSEIAARTGILALRAATEMAGGYIALAESSFMWRASALKMALTPIRPQEPYSNRDEPVFCWPGF
jgi:hypothetical protein